MLRKPRRWLAYDIQVNDLLPCYERILDRFEASDIPIDGVFGSNTEAGTAIPGILVALGPGVEPARLCEVLSLLDGLGQLFLCVHDGGSHSKEILIGGLNLSCEPFVALDETLLDRLSHMTNEAASLCAAIEGCHKIHPLGSNDSD